MFVSNLCRAVAVHTLAVIVLLSTLSAQEAGAVTLQFEADVSDTSRNGTIVGEILTSDLDGSGGAGVDEILSFTFSADFTGTALDFTADQSTHSVLLLPGSGSTPLAEGLDFAGLLFLGQGPGSNFLNRLTLTADNLTFFVLGVAQFGPASGVPQLVRLVDISASSQSSAPVTATPLPGTLALLLPVLGLLVLLGRIRARANRVTAHP